MASETRVSASLQCDKNLVHVAANVNRIADMAGTNVITIVQDIGTSAEALSMVDVTTIGYILLRNLDPTNYVELGLDAAVTAQVFAKLLPGDIALFPAKTATMYAKANTAGIQLQIVAVEL
jgi:hypothetical protein